MILLLTDALLLFFISISLGLLSVYGLEKILGISISSDILGIFLTGLISSAIYFNIISFWLPVNYLTLIPLLALGFRMINTAKYRQLLLSARRQLSLMRIHWFSAGCIGILLFLYWIKPSTSPDSSSYHITAILWYEKFKAVPGLGNLHGRLAFNPISFIIQAAYSLTGIAGQPVYSLNGMTIILFLLWIFMRMIRNTGTAISLIYLFFLILFYRPLLGYMSSPSSEPLVFICIAYPLIRIFELLLSTEEITLSNTLVLFGIALSAPVAKISAYPAAIILLYIFYLLIDNDTKPIRLILLLFFIGVLVYLPWAGRNYILSGYLVYPLSFTDFFHPDWKVPLDMLLADYAPPTHSPRGITNSIREFRYLDHAPFAEWFIRLLRFKIKLGLYPDLLLLATTVFSPVLWLFQIGKDNRPAIRSFLFWLAIYLCVWIWITTSMENRFGMPFILLSFLLPLLSLASSKKWDKIRISPYPAMIVLCMGTVYYLYGDYKIYNTYFEKRRQAFRWQECLIFPLKDPGTFINNEKKDFPYRTLHSGVRLYNTDSTHDCLNADFPCQPLDAGWEYEEIEMRGQHLDQGFKSIKVIHLER